MRFFLFVFLLFNTNSFSQNIKGKVVDQKNQPLYGANIYFDGTTIGTMTNENGEFTLTYATKTNSVLVISFVGYQTVYLDNIETKKPILITLQEANNTLNEIVLKNDRFSRKDKLKVFRAQFIGTTANSRKTKILNEDDIYFEYDKKDLILKAFSDVPLIIENKALGYKISYELIVFETAFSHHNNLNLFNISRSYYSGLSRFEEMESNDKIIKKREKSYLGSRVHFFRNLVNNVWNKDNFLIFKGGFHENASEYFNISDEGEFKKVVIRNKLKTISDKKAFFEFNVLFKKNDQSKIIFQTDTFYVDKFGNNSNIEDIFFSGQFSLQKVGDLLPLNYGIE